jgi:hypothetical protein
VPRKLVGRGRTCIILDGAVGTDAGSTEDPAYDSPWFFSESATGSRGIVALGPRKPDRPAFLDAGRFDC